MRLAILYLSLAFSLSAQTSFSHDQDFSSYSDQELLQEAKKLVDQHQYAEAVSLYEKLLSEDSNNIEYLKELGSLYVKLGDYKKAIEYYQRGLSINPDNQELEVFLAYAYLFDNNLRESKKIFNKVIKTSPDNADALTGLGKIEMMKGNLPESEQFFSKAFKKDSNEMTVTARLYLGHLRILQHRIPEAKEIFEKLNIEEPNNPDIQQGLFNAIQTEKEIIELKEKSTTIREPTPSTLKEEDSKNEDRLVKQAAEFHEQKKYQEESEIYEELVSSNPQNVDYLLTLGQLYVLLDRKNEAIYLYERALSIQPKRQDVRMSLAFAFLFENELEKSQKLFEIVLRHEPNNIEVLGGLGNIAAKKGRLKESEDLLEKALQIDPKNITILTYLADLKERQNSYSDAYKIYKKIAEIDPHHMNVSERLINLDEKMLLEQSQQLLKEKRYEDAKDIFLKLSNFFPKNADYFVELANIYQLRGEKIERIQALNHALELEPNRQDIKILLAFAYLTENQQDKSKRLFQSVLEKEPNHSDALAGIGRVAALQNSFEEAEDYYHRALESNPNNATAFEFLASLKLSQKKYKEASIIYSKLLSINPLNVDYRQGFQNSQERPLAERALQLRESKNYDEASTLYEQLIVLSPENIDYYLMLGQTYLNMKRKKSAVNLYNQGLLIKPHDKELLKALGFIYLNQTLDDVGNGALKLKMRFPCLFLREKISLYMSKNYFDAVLVQDPQDATAIAALGRIALIEGSVKDSENLYFASLTIEPNNTTALSYLAALQTLQKKYCTADDTYQYLMEVDPNDIDVRTNYKNFLNIKRPYLDVFGFYAEENEKDPITDQWAARLINDGVGLTYVSPVNDQLKIVGNIICDYIFLKGLISHQTLYSLEIKRPKCGFILNCTPYLSIVGGAGLVFFSQYQHSVFFTKSGCYFLPYYTITYQKNYHTLSIETIGDAPIVARNFKKNKSTLIARQFLNGFYEYDFGRRRSIGALASYAWYYNNIRNNQYQMGTVWFQYTPPCYWENISLRYQFIYSRFNDLTVDYYTFQPQISHWLKLDLIKKWCCDQIIAEAGYWHCWQNSFEQGQIITIVPVPFFHWVNREINYAYARAKAYLNDCLNVSVGATYSHDTFDYTTASVLVNVHFRF